MVTPCPRLKNSGNVVTAHVVTSWHWKSFQSSKALPRSSLANQRIGDAQQQLGGLDAARSQQTKQLEEHESEIRELNDTLYRARMEHDADTVRVQQQQQQLAAQVRAYHQDLLDTMRQVSAAQAQDNRQTAAA